MAAQCETLIYLREQCSMFMKLLQVQTDTSNISFYRQPPKQETKNHFFVIKGGIDCFKPSRKVKPQEIVLEMRYLHKNLAEE